ATVTAQQGTLTPSGSVNFFVFPSAGGFIFLGNGTLNGSGVATVTSNSLPPDNYTMQADYFSNSSSFRNSSDFSQPAVTINKADTAPTLAQNLATTVFSQPTTLTATVAASSPSAATPAGSIQFQLNGVNFGSAVTLSGGQALITVPTALIPAS